MSIQKQIRQLVVDQAKMAKSVEDIKLLVTILCAVAGVHLIALGVADLVEMFGR